MEIPDQFEEVDLVDAFAGEEILVGDYAARFLLDISSKASPLAWMRFTYRKRESALQIAG